MYQLITIVGNVGKDAEIRYLRDGTAVTDFTVAVNKYTGRGDERKETTLWFKCTIWRERAENAAQFIKKGTKILVTGEVSASAYIDKKTGEARASLEITIGNYKLLSSRTEMQGAGGGDDGQYPGEEAPAGGGRGGGRSGGGYDRRPPADDADEIPF